MMATADAPIKKPQPAWVREPLRRAHVVSRTSLRTGCRLCRGSNVRGCQFGVTQVLEVVRPIVGPGTRMGRMLATMLALMLLGCHTPGYVRFSEHPELANIRMATGRIRAIRRTSA